MTVRYLADIKVPPGRIRKTFSDAQIEELVSSIQTVGLLHPPVVEDDGTLLCGERRFRALSVLADRGITYHSNGKWITPGLIMTLDIRDLTVAQRLQAELDENTVRVDVSWQEKAEAVQALHSLRESQAAALATEAGLPDPPPRTLAATAAEVRGKLPDEVTRQDERDIRADLMVQTWIISHPDDSAVANAKSRAEALKIIETRLEDEHRAALARRFLATRAAVGFDHIIERADALVKLEKTPESIYDVIITDPPWGSGADKWTNQASVRQHSYADDLSQFETLHLCLAQQGFRIAKPKAHLYLFCAHQKFEWLAKLFRSFAWDVWPRPLIWYKGTNQGIAPRPEHGPRNTYECILFANKGDKRTLSLKPDVIFAQADSAIDRAAQKPVAIYYDLLSRSVLPGDEVLDPCCGTGPLIPAATALQCRATCYDTDEVAIGLTSQRLDERYSHIDPFVSARAPAARAG